MKQAEDSMAIAHGSLASDPRKSIASIRKGVESINAAAKISAVYPGLHGDRFQSPEALKAMADHWEVISKDIEARIR